MATKKIIELPPITADSANTNSVFVCSNILEPETSIIKFGEYFKYSIRNLVEAGDGFSKTENSDGTFTFAGTVQPSLSQTLVTGNNWISFGDTKYGISLSEANGLSISMSPINYGTGTVADGKSHVLNMTLTNWGKSYFSDTINIGGVDPGTESVNNYLYVAGSVFDYPHPFVVNKRGRVGINKIEPIEFLDVVGNAAIDGTITATGSIATLGEFNGNINWSYVLDTPTTLAGYGISDTDPLLDKTNNPTFSHISVNTTSGKTALIVNHNSANNIITAVSSLDSFIVTPDCRVLISKTSSDVDEGHELSVFGDARITGTIYGNISGTDITANTVVTTADNSSSTTQYLTFVGSAVDGDAQEIKINSDDLKYNRTSHTLNVTNIAATNNITAKNVTLTNTVSAEYGTIDQNLTVNETLYFNKLETNNSNPLAAYAELINILYPVGFVYTSVNSTNPGTLFGGTWVAFGSGRVLIGAGDGYDGHATKSFAAGTTGGVYDVTLTSNQSGLRVHNHPITDKQHQHAQYGTGNSDNAGSYQGGGNVAIPQAPTGLSYTGITGTENNTALDAAESHTNTQPYIVVYMWQRIA